MNADGVVYIDTSALAKWYLNEEGSDTFSAYIQTLDSAIISTLTRTEIRSLLARRRRMGDLDVGLEPVLYAAFQDDISSGHLQLYTVANERFDEAANLLALYPEQPLRTLDALHLAVAKHYGIGAIATADTVMANAAAAMGFAVRTF
ncbi:type II toxin-antitoxin system VapC family toxin [Sulfurivermis fontis]|uniref:type II toxin-antitoxin system VapC family toxin n=1 Tax=Sulfurivermis fontis TaxID=1972068 RepID=UPI000FDC830D|nr:type II toxin-antitoxin system VapC family toxin [Sulfurivermis fontis]